MTSTVQASVKTCRLVTADTSIQGIQGLDYAVGISAERVGSTGLHMQTVTIPPGARAKAHLHAEHETAIYGLSGVSGCWYGDALEDHAVVGAGDFFYIPAGVAHLPYNPSETEPFVAIIAAVEGGVPMLVKARTAVEGFYEMIRRKTEADISLPGSNEAEAAW